MLFYAMQWIDEVFQTKWDKGKLFIGNPQQWVTGVADGVWLTRPVATSVLRRV
jgi:hypothetical protein